MCSESIYPQKNEFQMVIKPSGAFWLNIGDSYKNKNLLGLNAKANIQFDEIARILEAKISDNTVFDISV